MRKKVFISMLLLSTTMFAMDHSNHNMQNHNTNQINSEHSSLTIPQDAKCSVCGMFVAKYDKWVATIQVEKEIFYFDGVKDMIKFYSEPTKYIKNIDLKNSIISVIDYYTLEQVDARNAFFVIGSNVMGPMGNELVPFKDENSANEFLKDHFGTKVLKFNEISLDILPTKHH
ncbi:hypothetical protein CRU87_08770 [Aliarcobacter trophiarum LMG 25534]|uniref:NosL domain-containing protein n=1 Tax=Aliarcobacter trophiarum LMG 25534 TaxID=1032241 RepID=A0AAD0VMS0_9BACT|nr:nitrous oxide reductase accessory protein NosL [Aliarcobacter trophiarum]AXK49201.1 NosL domain-containing protein [Aliarcobacter trophiarum LMG 25534]RXI25523.1 hypothetical protein CRU89_07665 [Aliarcobacter trophiarum]RXJ89829.1 hypothetical protein CRU87_08770 [Aliarcobacter trophiarum LMG 25534]